jgi:segregation and condensation protein A
MPNDESINNNNNDDYDRSRLQYTISKPPINVLFNPNLVSKKGIWSINISYLLELFIKILESMKKKDLRLCGIAVLSSSIIFRIKVESIFILERIAEQSRYTSVNDVKEIKTMINSNVNILAMPYRHEATYDITLEELLAILSNIVQRIYSSSREDSTSIEPIDYYDDSHLIDLESVIGEYKERLYTTLNGRDILFSEFVSGLDPLDVARYFIAMLHLCMEGKISIEQIGEYDIKIALSDKNGKIQI